MLWPKLFVDSMLHKAEAMAVTEATYDFVRMWAFLVTVHAYTCWSSRNAQPHEPEYRHRLMSGLVYSALCGYAWGSAYAGGSWNELWCFFSFGCIAIFGLWNLFLLGTVTRSGLLSMKS